MTELRDGRGRIRCASETGYWRDCGDWAVRWGYVYDSFVGEMRYWPFCEKDATELGVTDARQHA